MIELNGKYGCLTVLDMGEEYSQSEKYSSFLEQKSNLEMEIKSYNEEREKLINENPSLPEINEHGAITNKGIGLLTKFRGLNYEINTRIEKVRSIEAKLSTHYKCQCSCGKTNYYNANTVESKPKFCFYPVPISTKFTYSTRASDATFRKKEKYKDIDCIVLRDKSKCMPSDEYCDYYNAYKTKQLVKKEEAMQMEIATLPRVNANNYNIDFTGRQYESFLIEECVNEHAESKPNYHFSQQHRKVWQTVTVYKEYRCRCLLCGNVEYFSCDKFGIFPPTEYGYHAYHGYWSLISCSGCKNRKVSSFQWIVNKLLFENSIPYRVEYTFTDLYGSFGINKLRFDFAILNKDGSLKCLIECQGEQHFMPVEEFGGEEEYERQVENDDMKRKYVQEHNIKYIEITYKQKKYETIKTILEANGII